MFPGTVIAGRYRIVHLVGRGGMGAVYKAIDLQTDRSRAIKLMLDHKVEDADARERFRLEAGVAGRIDSPFVVDVLDTGVDADTGTPFIVMELLEGENLEQRLARLGPRPADEVVEHLRQVARALRQMHARDVVHRDLKPSNLFLDERDRVAPRIKVLDLGVAKVLSATGGDTTAVVGSVPYMAPEQIHGRPVGPATDLYALGLIAFTLLTGAPYWVQGRDEASIGLAMRIADGPSLPASARARDAGVELAAAFDAWFARATAREPGRRFRSAPEAVRALAGALGVESPPADDEPDAAASDAAFEATPSQAMAATVSMTGMATPPLGVAAAASASNRGKPARASAAAALSDRANPARGMDATVGAADRANPAHALDETVGAMSPASPAHAMGAGASEPGAAHRNVATEIPPSGALPARSQPRRRGFTRAVVAVVALVAVMALGGVTVGAWWLWPGAPGVPASPLARPASVLACPILEVEGTVSEWGWLGAAAAVLSCERGRVLLGGLPSRTQMPAELLDLRRAMEFDDDPYVSDDARERSLKAARQSDAYLDGRVSRLGSADSALRFRVSLTLRRPDTTEVKAAAGEGNALYEAVRAAMNELVAAGAIPIAAAPDAVVAEYSRARDVDTLLHLLDWALAMANNAGGIETECAWFTHADDATDLASFLRWVCKYTVGDPTPDVVLPQGTTPGARAARARIEHQWRAYDDPAAIEALKRQYDAEASTWGKSVIATTLACLLQAGSRDEARTWAWRAVSEPKNPTGEWCAPLGQLVVVTDDTSSETWATVQWRVWAPWEAYAWRFAARNTRSAERALVYAERAYVLSPLDTNMAGELADRLLRKGGQQAARVSNIAARLAGSRFPVHQILNKLLTVRFDASEARFGRALEMAREAMQPRPNDAGWVIAQRLELAWHAVEIGHVLGRASEVADQVVAAFVEPRPPVLDWASIDTLRHVTAICAYASPQAAERCFARLDQLTPSSRSPLAAGARLYAAGDHRGAAREWQSLIRNADEQVDLLAEAMVRAFSAAGQHDVAVDIEARTRDAAALFDGANMAMARAAQAAQARGHRDEAARLARRVIDAWKQADPSPPILVEMRKLVE